MGDLMSEKLRAEFEAAIKKNQLAGGFGPANLDRCGFDDSYVLPEVAGAWWGWQASRETLVIELPGACECCHDQSAVDMNEACAQAIEAAGLKVQS